MQRKRGVHPGDEDLFGQFSQGKELIINGFGVRRLTCQENRRQGEQVNLRQGNQLRGQCCENKGHKKDNCHEHKKKIQKQEMFREKKEDVVILDIKDVKEYNRKKEFLGFKSKEHCYQ